MARPAFSAWLRKQKDRNDPVGDAAREFIAGAKLKDHPGFYASPTKFMEHIEDYASDGWLAAYEKAIEEWKALK